MPWHTETHIRKQADEIVEFCLQNFQIIKVAHERSADHVEKTAKAPVAKQHKIASMTVYSKGKTIITTNKALKSITITWKKKGLYELGYSTRYTSIIYRSTL